MNCSKAIAWKSAMRCIRGAMVGTVSMPQGWELGQGGLQEAGLSSAQESLAQALPSLPLTLSFPLLVGGVVRYRWKGALSHLGRDLAPPGQGRLRSCVPFRKNVEKRWLLENMDGAFLVLDEIVDGG